jgi:hypothetical protein
MAIAKQCVTFLKRTATYDNDRSEKGMKENYNKNENIIRITKMKIKNDNKKRLSDKIK